VLPCSNAVRSDSTGRYTHSYAFEDVLEVSSNSEIEFVRLLVTDHVGRYLFAKSLFDRDSIEYLARATCFE
jgi:hypothetical protein